MNLLKLEVQVCISSESEEAATNGAVCVCSLPAAPSDSQVTIMKTLVESLPEENYESLRYLITFLVQVQHTHNFSSVL